MPIAGRAKRFEEEGFTFPKPLINVLGQPMITRAIQSLNMDGRYIFIVRKDHLDNFNLESVLDNATNGNYDIIITPEVTEGAACSVLLAKQFINSSEELVIANCDQIIKYNKINFNLVTRNWCDGVIFCFESTHPKWSFVKIDDEYFVTEVAEKKPISNLATCGVYYYGEGKLFVTAAEEMINANYRVNNEFYVAPVFNYMLSMGADFVIPFMVDRMIGLGTPEDLRAYESSES